MTDREEFRQKLEAKLDEWDAEIEKLRARAKAQGAELKQDYADELAELKAQRDDVAKKLTELQDASGPAFADLKSSVEAAWGKLQDGLKKATERFR